MAARTTNALRTLTKQTSSQDWFGQPRGMAVVCAVEMWEVFSMQGMRTLLVYYLTTQLLFSQPRASSIYGTYIAFVFLTPLAGAARRSLAGPAQIRAHRRRFDGGRPIPDDIAESAVRCADGACSRQRLLQAVPRQSDSGSLSA